MMSLPPALLCHPRRFARVSWWIALACVWLGCLGCGRTEWVDLLDSAHRGSWQTAPAYSDATPWTCTNGVFAGNGSWVVFPLRARGFVLELSFLYDGSGEGGIVFRGDALASRPWLSGYELDIAPSQDPTRGHLHYPNHPHEHTGDIRFEPAQWHTVRIVANEDTVVTVLDDRDTLAFVDTRFRYGALALEGDGVQYRDIRIQIVEPAPLGAPRTPHYSLFDGYGEEGWDIQAGSVTIEHGDMLLDGTHQLAKVATRLPTAADTGVVEIGLWPRFGRSGSGTCRLSLYNAGELCAVVRTPDRAVLVCEGAAIDSVVLAAPHWPEYWQLAIREAGLTVSRNGMPLLEGSCVVAVPAADLQVAVDSCTASLREAWLLSTLAGE